MFFGYYFQKVLIICDKLRQKGIEINKHEIKMLDCISLLTQTTIKSDYKIHLY